MQFGAHTYEEWLSQLNIDVGVDADDANGTSGNSSARVVQPDHLLNGATHNSKKIARLKSAVPSVTSKSHLRTGATESANKSHLPSPQPTAPISNGSSHTHIHQQRQPPDTVTIKSKLSTPTSSSSPVVSAPTSAPLPTPNSQSAPVIPAPGATVSHPSTPTSASAIAPVTEPKPAPAEPAPPRPAFSWAKVVANRGPKMPRTAPSVASPSPQPQSPPIVSKPKLPLPPLPRRRIRGLANAGNTCFANVILQSLMACDDFRRFLLSRHKLPSSHQLQLLNNFIQLAVNMSVPEDQKPESVRDKSSLPNVDEPLHPTWAPESFPSRKTGNQEDAQEFLTHLVDKLSSLLVSDKQKQKPTTPEIQDSDGWQEVVPGGKSITVRVESSSAPTEITRIFYGQLRNELKRPGQPTSSSREPFFNLQLDIESGLVRNVTDALGQYFRPENLTDIEAKKQARIESLPQVLVLNLKRYSHGEAGAAKIGRRCDFSETLVVPTAACAFQRSIQERSYKLVAAVTHQGRECGAGHYVCDVRVPQQDAPDIWVHCDDSKVTRTQLSNVLQRRAYLLFFARQE